MNRVLSVAVLLSAAVWTPGCTWAALCVPNQDAPVDTARAVVGGDLHGVTVTGDSNRSMRMRTSVNNVIVDKDFLRVNFAGSLMQSLSSIPGVQAISIGSGQSKPAIRGLGFNRMVVAEDGIKHEGQQWGDEHGLEIDQFAVDRLEVVKGPGALLYGSDAIGGVISLYTNYVPTEPFQGSLSVFSRSNNASLGFSAKVAGRQGRFFYKANFTAVDYADYKVPTDSIQYYSYFIRLKDRTLRNTAGGERDGSLMLGYKGYRFHTDLKVSDSYSKSGFFANAHGIEVRMSDIDYDRSRRDIDLPYQTVNHLKVMSHSLLQLDNLALEANLAYQNNLREEFSEPVGHGYMPIPDGTLERRFNKSTYTGILSMKTTLAGRHDLNIGMNGEYQRNRRGGWGFVIPDFEMASFGAYVFDSYSATEKLVLNVGLRFDHARTHIHSYTDWYKSPTGTGADSVYVERAANLKRSFNSFTWSAGVCYKTGPWLLKANVGKSFRVPIAKELGTDGVNYQIFRYEKGEAGLDPEQSYQLDAGVNWSNGAVNIQVDPYLNYFPNYIYLNPTADYYDGLQMYYYTQSRVMRYGLEVEASWRVRPRLQLRAQGEYLHARQLSGDKKGYSLPFTPPMSGMLSAEYMFAPEEKGKGFVSVNLHAAGRQNDIVPPEKPTPGHCTLGLTAGKTFMLSGFTLHLTMNAENLLNKRYYDHTSYYRLIDVPEPGRNVALMVGIDF